MTSAMVVRGSRERLYGGDLMGATLTAAEPLAHEGARVHATHVLFLDAGSPHEPVDLEASVVQATRSFTRVVVEATQPARRLALATVSFATPRPGRAHAATTSWPAGRPDLAPDAYGGPIPALDVPSRRPVDLRHVEEGPVTGPDGRPVLRYWVRWRDAAPGAAALLWVSDLCLTRVADLEHEDSPGTRRAASLDQTTWFHGPVDLGRWHLYEVTSPHYGDGLALSTGLFYDERRQLVATVAQQSLLVRA